VTTATFRDVIDGWARSRPTAAFLVAPEPAVTLTYADLAASARALSAGIAAEGVAEGDVVGFMLGNGVAADSARADAARSA